MPKPAPRIRKHKALARQRAAEGARHHIIEDTNQEILPAEKKQKREAGRKDRVSQQLGQDGEISAKKAKRLEKYIDGKLKKDENRQLLAKLAASQGDVDTSLFSSSRSLGARKETKKQRLGRALREKNAGIDDNGDVLYQKRPEANESEDDEDEEEGKTGNDDQSDFRETLSDAPATTPTPASVRHSTTPATAGSGLKRPLEVDDDGRPVIPKRQRRGGIKSKLTAVQIQSPPTPSDDDDDDDDNSDSDGSSEEDSNSDEWGGLSDENGAREPEDELSAGDAEGDDSSEGEFSSGSQESSSNDSSEEDSGDDEKPRVSGFKAWAIAQRDKAQDFTPTESTTNMTIPKPDNFVPRAIEQDPLPEELRPSEGSTDRKAFSVTVERTQDIQDARMKLPVVAEEQRVMEAIHNNDVVVICGATGSGKTTQIPQFLFEAGYGAKDGPTSGLIGVTQPRRVAAVSMSKRVGEELGDHEKQVAYQIRFEGNVGSETSVKFMTDGVLLRELANDLTLSKYSAIVIDEAHERSVNTDILIGMLSRVIRLKQRNKAEGQPYTPLKLIVMSATLRIEDLTMNRRLFEKPPPVINVEGRQHPVTVHFSRRTTADYVEEAFRKIRRGHKKLPPGGFLVFLTGRNEITQLSKRLKEDMGGLRTADAPKVSIPATEAPTEAEDIEFGDVDDRVDDGGYDSLPEDESDEEEEDEFKIEDDDEAAPLKMQILPLYSLLPTKEQMRVFQEPPEGTRQIILATNVAETSLTIPGTRFVFDCGRSKERQYHPVTGVQSFQIGWISKASASQRSGRAGRTGPGHCYRLYSSAVYERDFEDFADPEILRMPLEGVALQLKAMNLRNVINFPFPTPPDQQMLARAEKVLTYLSAIKTDGKVTEVGNAMNVFPLAPRYARILLVGHAFNCIHYTIAMVAGLSAQEIFIPENQAVPDATADENFTFRSNSQVLAEDRRAQMLKRFREVHRNFCFLDDKSDAIKLLQVVGEFALEPNEEWAEGHYVRFKMLKEIQQLRKQITEILRTNMSGFANLRYQDKLDAPDSKQVAALKQMAAAGFIDQIAIRGDLAPTPPEMHRKPRRPIDVPYVPLQPLPRDTEDTDQCVYIHPTSTLAHVSTQECPSYIVYSHLQQSIPSAPGKKPKTRMSALTDVSGGQLATLAKGTPLLTYGKPIKEWNVGTDRADGCMTREAIVVPYLRAERTVGQGWPLPSRKVKQKKMPGQGWIVL